MVPLQPDPPELALLIAAVMSDRMDNSMLQRLVESMSHDAAVLGASVEETIQVLIQDGLIENTR